MFPKQSLSAKHHALHLEIAAPAGDASPQARNDKLLILFVFCQLSTVNCKLSIVNCQLSIVNCQLNIKGGLMKKLLLVLVWFLLANPIHSNERSTISQ